MIVMIMARVGYGTGWISAAPFAGCFPDSGDYVEDWWQLTGQIRGDVATVT